MRASETHTRITALDVVLLSILVSLGACLLFPYAGTARESARQAKCSANLRSLGTAMQSYLAARNVLPAAAIRRERMAARMKHGDEGPPPVARSNWALALLPYLDEQALDAAFRKDFSIADLPNASVREAELAVLTCPSDAFHSASNDYEPVTEGPRYARGNYAMNAGSNAVCLKPGTREKPCPGGGQREFDEAQGVMSSWGNGVAGFNKVFSRADFVNGLSKIVALEEVRAGVHPLDSRGVWSLGEIGASITYAHGLYGDDGSPNCTAPRSDDVVGCMEMDTVVGRSTLQELRMPCCWYCPAPSAQATARSMHPGGVQVMFLDSSVRFVMDDVDRDVWHGIHSRDTSESVLASF